MAAPDTQQRQLSAPLLDYLARLLRAKFESQLDPEGLRPRHLLALVLLREQEGASTQQALAASLQLDRTNVVGLLNELERKGLLRRRRSDEDRRRHIVELTAAGREELTAAECRMATVEDEVLGALGEREREQLLALLTRATNSQAIECREQPPSGLPVV